MTRLRITADAERCVGSGQCVLTAPHIFDQGDDGLVRLLTDVVGEEDRASVEDAAHYCPARALGFGTQAEDV